MQILTATSFSNATFRFQKLLAQTLPYIMEPHLQAIPMALLQRFPDKVEDDVLQMLKDDPALFEVRPTLYNSSVLTICADRLYKAMSYEYQTTYMEIR